VHGFRTTFRTWAQEETDFEEAIVEHCLHHITGDDAEKAYKRGEALRKRRIVMQAFADFATLPPKNNVTSIRVAQRFGPPMWTDEYITPRAFRVHRADFPRTMSDRCG
jgi:hypothetical protein